MKIFYNEFDPFAANWLRELQRAYHIPPGFIQEKSIEQVKAKELQGFKQAHFFAGIGGWPLALKLAGWPEGGAVWTGSCPCQPFSDAGLRKGVSDKRHLFPTWRRLIKDCLPPVIFGEQVASAAGRDWLAGVRADLEGLGYGVGGADLCAAGFGAPHIRQRLYWMAYARSAGRKGQFSGPQKIGASADAPKQKQQLAGHGTARRLDHGQRIGRHAQRDHYQGDDGIKPHPAGQVRRLGDPSGASLAPSQPQVLRGSGRGKKGEQLSNQVAHQVLGPATTSSHAATAKRAVLAPAFSLWLMGYPTGWESCAERGTPLSRSKRRPS